MSKPKESKIKLSIEDVNKTKLYSFVSKNKIRHFAGEHEEKIYKRYKDYLKEVGSIINLDLKFECGKHFRTNVFVYNIDGIENIKEEDASLLFQGYSDKHRFDKDRQFIDYLDRHKTSKTIISFPGYNSIYNSYSYRPKTNDEFAKIYSIIIDYITKEYKINNIKFNFGTSRGAVIAMAISKIFKVKYTIAIAPGLERYESKKRHIKLLLNFGGLLLRKNFFGTKEEKKDERKKAKQIYFKSERFRTEKDDWIYYDKPKNIAPTQYQNKNLRKSEKMLKNVQNKISKNKGFNIPANFTRLISLSFFNLPNLFNEKIEKVAENHNGEIIMIYSLLDKIADPKFLDKYCNGGISKIQKEIRKRKNQKMQTKIEERVIECEKVINQQINKSGTRITIKLWYKSGHSITIDSQQVLEIATI